MGGGEEGREGVLSFFIKCSSLGLTKIDRNHKITYTHIFRWGEARRQRYYDYYKNYYVYLIPSSGAGTYIPRRYARWRISVYVESQSLSRVLLILEYT